MGEPEMHFYELADNMRLAEEFIRTILKAVLERCPDDMKFFAERIDKTVLETLENIVSHEFLRLSYTEAIDILQKSGQTFEYPVEWGRDRQSDHERELTAQKFKQPVIRYAVPRRCKSMSE